MTPIDVQMSWMVKSDLADVLAIEDECFPHDPWNESTFTEAIRQKHVTGLVAKNNFGRTVGFVVYECQSSRYEIWNMAVARICQRHRIGTQILNSLKQRLNERRPRLAIHVVDWNLGAHLFLRANSFQAVRVDRDYFESSDGTKHDGYRMVFKQPPRYVAAAEAVTAAYGGGDL